MKGWWLTLRLLRNIYSALQRHNALMEEFLDEYRMAHDRRPVYMEVRPSGGHMASDPEVAESFAGDDAQFGRIEFLREHARMSGEIVDDLTDIEALAAKRGWVDRDGNLTIEGGNA